MNGYGRGPEHPVARAVMLERADQAYGDDGDAELLGETKAAVLEFVDVTVAGALGFRKNDEAGAAIDGVVGQPPHALDVGGASHVGDRNVAEALHEPAVGGDLEMGFKLPSAHDLRNRTIEHERVKDVDVVDHEEAGASWIEVR